MATVEIITLTDSLDERIKNGVETVTFFHPVFGTKHEIELSEKNREHFAAHLAKLDKYIDAAREIVEVKPEPAKAGSKSDGRISAIRTWAQANGFAVGDRGRIKSDIVEAYDAAQSAKANPDTDAVASGDEPVKLVEVSTEAPELEDAKPNTEPVSEAVSDDSDPTANMTAEEFEKFIMDNMDNDGLISPEALAKADDSE
jgi:hypothetical protein